MPDVGLSEHAFSLMDDAEGAQVEKVVPRGWLGRLLGLKPKTYRCYDDRDGTWHREHQPPIWMVGFYGNQSVPCCRCFKPSGQTGNDYVPASHVY